MPEIQEFIDFVNLLSFENAFFSNLFPVKNNSNELFTLILPAYRIVFLKSAK